MTNELTIEKEKLTAVQRRVLAQIGLMTDEEDETDLKYRYKAIIRTARFDEDLRRYVEGFDVIETDRIKISELGDIVFPKEGNTDDEGNDLVVPRTSILWIGREWKKAEKEETVKPSGQYL